MQLPSRPNTCTFLRMFFTRSALLFLFFAGGILPVQAATITLVQHASKDAGISSSSSLSFPANSTTGDWVAVCIRAGKSGQVLTVKDSNGNTYRTAFQFNVTADTPNGETVAIFYAENIAGGANTVTVSESIASNTLRFAILEYSGVATANSLDVAVGAQGTSASPNSGAATTTSNGDLLLGVAVTANGATDTAGSGFVIEDRVPAAPNTKLITESQIQSTAGPASASASLGASDIWGAALAAFKAASGGPTPPSITSLSPTSGAVGTAVTITGANFGTTQGSSTVTFNGISAGVATSWTATSITIPVPANATTGPVVLNVGGQASNAVNFTVTVISVSLTPATMSLPAGVSTLFTATVQNNVQSRGVTWSLSGAGCSGTSCGTLYAASGPTTTGYIAPSNMPSPPTVTLTATSVADPTKSASATITITPAPPSITSLNPTSGPVGIYVAIAGANFGATQGSSTVSFNGVPATPSYWSVSSITVPVPTGASSGNVVVTVGGAASNGVAFTVLPTPSISSLSPTSGPYGTLVTITGTNLGVSQGTNLITFNGFAATATSWSTTSIVVPVPAGAMTGNVVVTVGGVVSNGVAFTVFPGPGIINVNPTSASVGGGITINGANFGSTQGTSTVTFNGTAATPISWNPTIIAVPVPANATSGNVVVTVNGVASNGVNFTVIPPPPSITSSNPTSGSVGTSVTITGTNFGSTQGTSTVTFNGASATPTNWSASSITVPVPTNATTGNVVVTVSGQASNGVPFTVIPPAAGIKLVQRASKDAGITTSSSLAFPANNTAGNWIAVCIRAGKAGQVISVSDSRGNTYHQAVLFNMTVDSDTLGVFYAENIAGGANTITVSDTISTGTLRFAIFEYSGIASSNSLDGSAAAQGVSPAPNSGNVPTTANGDLVLGTILTANPATFTAGSGFLIEATAPAEPNSKVMVEDGVQSLAGPVSAAASLASSDSWGAAIAAFKSAGGGAGAGPTITSLSPTSGPAGTAVTITGANFGSSQGSSTVTFNGTLAAPTSWGATSIGVPVPAGATTGNVVVTVGGTQSNGVNFITGPISVAISPTAPTVAAGTTQSFTASVQNDPSSLGVTWSLSGAGCTGAACGTLSSITPTSVLYTAPNTAPNPATVSVVATSVADNTKSATASVTIGPPPQMAVSVSPATSTVSINLTQLFSATVQYDFSNQGVNWTLSGAGCTGTACGALTNPTSNGNSFGITYTAPSAVPAPATVSITASSVADSTKSGSSTITVSQGIPTSLGWFQIPNTLLQPVCPNIPQIQGAIGCQGVIAAWNGGIADTNRNRLLFTGGGHQNYWGNEVYSLNLTDLTLTRINNPVFPSSIPSCTEDWGNPPTVPSTPAARETYSGLAYVQHLDKMWLFGGALGTSGCRSTGMWMLDLPTLTWQRMDPTNGTQETVYTDINYADYDPQTKLVYVYIANNDVLASYNPDTNTMIELLNHNSYGVGAYSNGVLDPKRHLFVILGAGFAGSYDLTTTPPTFRKFSSQTVGCSGIQGPNYPGLAYDPVQDKIVGWAGGNTVYLFDTPTLTCTAVTYPGGPPAQQTNGTYGRWRYFPALNVFALVNDWKQNAYTLRLTPAP